MDYSQVTQHTFVLRIQFSVFLAPVHFDLPVGGRAQRDPADLSSVVGAVHTTKDHLTALLTMAKGRK